MVPQEFADAEDQPRSMRLHKVRLQRLAMLDLPHMVPLRDYAARLRMRGPFEVPEFDPLDGGINARALFLLEKPGPMTAAGGKRVGSGFISRNNDDSTAEATFHFMRQAGIPRRATVLWNVVPWWNGTREVTREEIAEGAACVEELVPLLPHLRAVVLVGKNARKASPYLTSTGLTLLSSDHPSPLVRARWPDRWKAIATEWAKVGPYLT